MARDTNDIPVGILVITTALRVEIEPFVATAIFFAVRGIAENDAGCAADHSAGRRTAGLAGYRAADHSATRSAEQASEKAAVLGLGLVGALALPKTVSRI